VSLLTVPLEKLSLGILNLAHYDQLLGCLQEENRKMVALEIMKVN
jgi:hypothetical protein